MSWGERFAAAVLVGFIVGTIADSGAWTVGVAVAAGVVLAVIDRHWSTP